MKKGIIVSTVLMLLFGCSDPVVEKLATDLMNTNKDMLLYRCDGIITGPKFVGLFRNDSVFSTNYVNGRSISYMYFVVKNKSVVSGSVSIPSGKTTQEQPLIIIDGATVTPEKAKQILSDSVMIHGVLVSKSDIRKLIND